MAFITEEALLSMLGARPLAVPSEGPHRATAGRFLIDDDTILLIRECQT
jgi:hypothetical protein